KVAELPRCLGVLVEIGPADHAALVAQEVSGTLYSDRIDVLLRKALESRLPAQDPRLLCQRALLDRRFGGWFFAANLEPRQRHPNLVAGDRGAEQRHHVRQCLNGHLEDDLAGRARLDCLEVCVTGLENVAGHACTRAACFSASLRSTKSISRFSGSRLLSGWLRVHTSP